jgi:hypothetical protein
MPFPTRVALAIALGIGVEHIRRALLANAKVRHDFAHGQIHELLAAMGHARWANPCTAACTVG